MKKIVLLLFVNIWLQSICATGYEIKVKIKGAENLELQLGHYYEDKQFVVQTIALDKNGNGIFTGEEPLAGGLYLITIPNINFFDLIIDNDQHFSIKTDTADIIKNMKIKGSTENELFYNYQNELVLKMQNLNSLKESLKNHTENTDSLAIITAQIDNQQAEIDSFWRQAVVKNKDTFFAKILTSFNDEGESSGKFYDKIDFSDERLIRSPIIYRTMRSLIAQTINSTPQNIINEIDTLLERGKKNKLMYQYMATYFLSFYNTFQKIGLNEVFVHIAENNFLNGKCDWMDSTAIQSIAERTRIHKASFVGQIAPELKMETPNEGEFVSLHQIDAKLTFLFFWKTGCGHCTESLEELKKFHEEIKGQKGIEIIAVYIKDSRSEWISFIEEHDLDWINCYDPTDINNYHFLYNVFSSPILYLLEEDKTIILKGVGKDQIISIIEQVRIQKEKFLIPE